MVIYLLQISPFVSELALYDIAATPGVAADISHINSRAKTTVNALSTVSLPRIPRQKIICSNLIVGSMLLVISLTIHQLVAEFVAGLSQGYVGDEQLEAALTGADIVIIPAGVPRKPGMTRDDLFNVWIQTICHHYLFHRDARKLSTSVHPFIMHVLITHLSPCRSTLVL